MGEEPQRRLAAIVSTDVVGYSRLIGIDEAGTLAALRNIRAELIDPLIERHGGRIVKTMGDGLLLEFPSVVNAATCSIAVQQGMAQQDMDLRIGINLGDIVIEADDIHGDGVNVAARLQEACEAGGLALSGVAHESLGNLVDATFEDAGPQEFKNIERPIRMWHWMPDTAPSPIRRHLGQKLAQADKPTIAVLPFDNMSGDPEHAYFADGIAEDITTELSRFGALFVVSRHSAFKYRGDGLDLAQVGRVRWSHLVGQFGGVVKVYSAV